MNLKTVRGTHDTLPQEQSWWRFVKTTLFDVADGYGFGEIATPIMEYDQIFTKAIGTASDIVAKEMYYLEGGDNNQRVALRPEGTAGVIRAYYENGLFNEPSPLRLSYYGPMFRHEKPQRGRLRQFHQFGVESIGEGNPSEDALCILMGKQSLDRLTLPSGSYNIEINSVGCYTCRSKYLKRLQLFLKNVDHDALCDDCTKRATTNPMRIFDCKNATCQRHYKNTPTPLDYLCNDCRTHFKTLLEYLEEAKVKFIINSHLVRGLDYYTRTVFEFISQKGATKDQAILAGGRYDDLVALFGNRNAPAIGYGIGIERLIQTLGDSRVKPPAPSATQVFVVQLGESAKRKSFTIIQQMVAAGIKVSSALSKDNLRSQLKVADRDGAQLAVIIGQREIIDKTIILKDMKSGGQETLEAQNCIITILERLKTPS